MDTNGTVRDKSNRLSLQKDGSYQNLSNDIRVTYPANIADGIEITKGNVSLQIIPENANNALVTTPIDGSSNEVCYPKAFGSNTMLRYTQTFTGFKEDIILIDQQELHSFSFEVLTNGAKIEIRNGLPTVILAGVEQGAFGAVYAYDAVGSSAFGETVVTERTPYQEYTLTISVPSAFLNAESTVYPVIIDPSITLNDMTSTKIIEDATVYTNYSSNYGTQAVLHVGNFDLATGFTRGEAYTLMKFPLLNNNNAFKSHYNAGRVTSIKVNFADTICGYANTIRAYRVTKTWTESTVVYSDVKDNLLGYPTSSALSITATNASPPYPRYNLEILPLVEKSGLSGIATMGIVLKPTSTDRPAITIGSSESGTVGGRSDSKPYVTYTYYSMPSSQTDGIENGGIYQFINEKTGKALSFSTTLTQQAVDASLPQQLFRVTYEEDGGYRIASLYNEMKYLNGSGTTLSLQSYMDSYTQNWYIIPCDGYYRIHSVPMENNVISTQNSSTALYLQNEKTGSLWKLRRVYYAKTPLINQEKTNSCGHASAVMILRHFNITVSVEDFYTECGGNWENPSQSSSQSGGQYNHLATIIAHMNDYLSKEGKPTYSSHYISASNYTAKITEGLETGHPILANMWFDTTSPHFGYSVPDGHYVVVIGLYYDDTSGENMVIVNDPHYAHCATVILPLSAMQAYNIAGNDHVSCAVSS